MAEEATAKKARLSKKVVHQEEAQEYIDLELLYDPGIVN